MDEVAQAIERGFRPGRWWRAIDREGVMLAETSNPNEFAYLGLTEREDVSFLQMYTRQDEEWVKVTLPEILTNKE